MDLIAAANGWTLEEAAAHLRAADIFGDIAGQVAAHSPDIYVGGVLSPEPVGPPSLYIKGPADDFVRSLVANAGIEIKIVDNQPFSSEELHEREMQVTSALSGLGFQNFAVSSRMTEGGQIEAAVTRQPGLPDDPAEILSAVPEPLRASVTLTVSDAPVAMGDAVGECGNFGPLAVIDAGGGDAAHGGTGPVDIGENCVTMPLPNGETLLLIWHAKEVHWNENEREITYTYGGLAESEPITIRDGDIIVVGGSSLLSDRPVEQNLMWLATPHPTCSGRPWAVTIFPEQ